MKSTIVYNSYSKVKLPKKVRNIYLSKWQLPPHRLTFTRSGATWLDPAGRSNLTSTSLGKQSYSGPWVGPGLGNELAHIS